MNESPSPKTSVPDEDGACAAIMRDLRRRSMVMPRFTPAGWWECDVFELTPTGYFREYEVKLTLADFKRDALKTKRNYGRPYGWPDPYEKKYDLLSAADTRGPVEFYYVTPEGLIDPSALPPFAGLIELWDRGSGHPCAERWAPGSRKVRAPRLHHQKANDKIRSAVLSACYYRFHDALTANINSERIAVVPDEPAPELQPDVTS